MECVVLYDYFWPAYKAGGPIQSIKNFVEYLGSDISISIVCSNCDLDGIELNVQEDTWTTLGKAKVYYSSTLSRSLPSISEDAIVFINGIYSLKFNLLPALKFKGRKIVSVRGMLHPEALMQKSFKKKVYLLVLKLLGLPRKCEFHATSEQERDYILNTLGKSCKIWVAPNFPHFIKPARLPKKEIGYLRLVSIALISRMKNHLLTLQALMKCKYHVEYEIYGPIKDADYWRKCELVINELPQNIVVRYCGSISPMQVEQALNSSHVMIQPSESENFGHSIIEALSCGRPVITSTSTPWNGLQQAKAGINVNIVNGFESLTNAINTFCEMDNDELKNWSDHATAYAHQSIDVKAIKQQYQNMLNNSR